MIKNNINNIIENREKHKNNNNTEITYNPQPKHNHY